jgi:parallel beta-helix repeat protein
MKQLQRDMLSGATALLLLAGCRSGVDEVCPKDGTRGDLTFYVAPAGSDAWSGGRSDPNRAGTDGPFATLARAREAVRALKAAGALSAPVTILLRGGRYYVTEPLRFGPEDSGTASCPITYAAYPKETPELIGGRRLAGFLPVGNGQMALTLPEVKAGTWAFRSLFINSERQVRARYPNLDPVDPCRRGFLYNGSQSGLGLVVGCIHNAGDWMEYKVAIPAAGDYTFWVFYGAQNANPGWNTGMSERTELTLDNGAPIRLGNLPDTGGWGVYKWSASATVKLTAGEHVMRWRNVKGGGLGLVAYAFCDDPAWKPVDESLPAVTVGKHRVLVSAAGFVASQGKQLTVRGSNKGSATVISCPPDVFKPAWLAPGAEVHVFQSGSCRAFMEIASIQGYDPETQAIRLRGPECQALLAAGDRYCVENVYEELDSPGEWYLNKQTGVLTCLPKTRFTFKTEVVAPTLGRLFDIRGRSEKEPVSNLHLSGLSFRCTDWELGDGCSGYGMGSDGVVYFGNAINCAVENCDFRNIGKNAVCIAGGRGNRVEGCDISYSGGGGVLILESPGNTVTDNHIHHCGEGYKHNGGVVLQGALASGNTVSHNAIHDMPRYGISLKNPGSTNVVEYNRVQNTSLETHDTGAIEVTQGDRNFRSGSIIRGNLVADSIGYSTTSDKPCFMSWGIYLDSFAGGYEVTGNITFRNTHGGIMLQGGKDNRVTNNIFVDSREMQGLIPNFSNNSRGEVLERNIFYWTSSNAVLFATGKQLTPEIIRVDSNLFYQVGTTVPRMGWGGWNSFADWQAHGFDTHSVFADPLFVDPATDNYALRPSSPAFKLGFAAIDARKIGTVKRSCSCTIIPAGPKFWTPRPAALVAVQHKK